MPAPSKLTILTTLRDKLESELERSRARAVEAAHGASHEENRAEGDKDMRATEASYVARGHAERTLELEQALTRLGVLELKEFAPGAAIQTSAVVELQQGARTVTYFLVPAAGGERIRVEGAEIQTLTPTSPLGAALLGLAEGDEAEVSSPQGPRIYEVVRVW